MIGAMLSACMVDGFGWFEPADYRRAWLFFDDVVYVLPSATSLYYRPEVLERDGSTNVKPELSAAAWQIIGDAARSDAADPSFRQVVDTIPASELRYSQAVVAGDREMTAALGLDRTLDPVLAVALLFEKLLLCASVNGMVPIVGRDWAARLLAARLTPATPGRDRTLLSPSQGETYAAFSAGLSLDFVDDDKLVALPFDRLRAFKDGHRDLLDRHQLHLIEVTRAFGAMPAKDQRDAALVELRLKAMKGRVELDNEAHHAIRSLGLDLLKKGVDGAISKEGLVVGMATALALNHSVGALVGGALLAGVGQSLSGLVDLWKARPEPHTNALAYLFATPHL
jgi:hypothetical protein